MMRRLPYSLVGQDETMVQQGGRPGMQENAPLRGRALHHLALAALALALAALPIACSSGSSGPTSDCDVCNVQAFDCTTVGLTGQATIDTVADTTCSGIIGVDDEMPRFWIDCSASTICVDHTDECFDANFSAQGFSYAIPGKGTTVSCTAK